MKKYLNDFKRRFDIQFFAGEGEGEGNGNSNTGSNDGGNANTGGQGNSGQTTGGNTQTQTLPLAEAERIASEREERARKSALKSFFEQQGYSQEDVERMLKEDKERREAAKTELQREKERADKAEAERKAIEEAAEKTKKEALSAANMRVAKTEFKIAAQAAGVPADRLEAAVKLADLSGLAPDESGEIPAAKIQAAVEATLTANAFLKVAAKPGVGSGTNPGNNTGNDPDPDIEKMTQAEYEAWRKKKKEG